MVVIKVISKELIDELQAAFEKAQKEYYQSQTKFCGADQIKEGTYNGLTIARNIVWKYK